MEKYGVPGDVEKVGGAVYESESCMPLCWTCLACGKSGETEGVQYKRCPACGSQVITMRVLVEEPKDVKTVA